MSDPKRKLVRVRGRVTSEVVKRGTASEHTGAVLETAEGKRLFLVRHGGNPFDDAPTRDLVGKTVDAKGYRIGDELRFVEAKVVE
jgi:hypothetical protein